MNLPPHLDHCQNLNHLHSQIVMNSKQKERTMILFTTRYISRDFVIRHNSECSLMLERYV